MDYPGNLFVVAAPSGAGKSSLVRLLLGLVPPTHGRISFDHADRRVDPVAARREAAHEGERSDQADGAVAAHAEQTDVVEKNDAKIAVLPVRRDEQCADGAAASRTTAPGSQAQASQTQASRRLGHAGPAKTARVHVIHGRIRPLLAAMRRLTMA